MNGQDVATIYNILDQPVKQFLINNEQLKMNTIDFASHQTKWKDNNPSIHEVMILNKSKCILLTEDIN